MFSLQDMFLFYPFLPAFLLKKLMKHEKLILLDRQKDENLQLDKK